MRQYCVNHGIEVVATYVDEESGGDLDRRGLDSAIGRITRGDITYLIARDESRLSRDMNDMAKIVDTIAEYGTVIRYVNSPVRPEEDSGKLMNGINTWQAEIERKKLRQNTRAGMLQRKWEGHHMGKFLAFAFEEDVDLIEAEQKGRINRDPGRSKNKAVTKIAPEDYIYSFAKAGKSLTYVAEKVLHISHSTLIAAMKPREAVPHIRRNKDGDAIEFYRYTGLKDRYTVYMTLYDEAISRRKGRQSERAVKPPENPSEREGERCRRKGNPLHVPFRRKRLPADGDLSQTFFSCRIKRRS